MSAAEVARVNLFLTITLPLLPVLWIVLALQTNWVRANLQTAMQFWVRSGGQRRSKGNFRATMWTTVVVTCFVTGTVNEGVVLVAILFGWEGVKQQAATSLLLPLLLSLGLVTWTLLLSVAAESSEDGGAAGEERT